MGIFPGAEKHCVDEEDLPITSTCDNPHTATLRTEPSTDTAAQYSLSSPSIRDDGNNAEGCVNVVLLAPVLLHNQHQAQKMK